jgi:hypothetical protein
VHGSSLDIGTGWYDQWDSYKMISFYASCSCGKTHLVRLKGDM